MADDATPRWGWKEWISAGTALVTILIGLNTAVAIAREEGRVTRASLEARLDSVIAQLSSLKEVFIDHRDHVNGEISDIRKRQDDVRERLKVVEDRVQGRRNPP